MTDMRNAGVFVVTPSAGQVAGWATDSRKLLDVVLGHHDGKADCTSIGPMASMQSLMEMRADLTAASPVLADFVATVNQKLQSSSAVFIPTLGLGGLDENTRALMVYAMASCMGNPTATDSKQVIWDVKARQRDSTYFSTFSETDLEAAYHTDTQYYPAPEKAFFLYCMTPAGCGGGLSSVCDARALRRDIESTERWVADVLADRRLPFRVPSAFVTTGDPDEVQATLAPVFAETPLIRYRRDTLEQGIRYFPECVDADAHRALDAFERHLRASPHQAEFFMPRDSLVVMDNHTGLHARTAFQDPARHLLRIRIHADAQASAPTSPYRLVSRGRQPAVTL